MNKSILSAVLLGTTTLATSAFAANVYTSDVVDPATGVVYNTTNAVYDVGRAPFDVFMPSSYRNGYTHRHGYIVTDTTTGMTRSVNAFETQKHHWVRGVNSCYNGVFPGVCQGTRYTITDENTGKKYRVIGVHEGTTDVIRGNKVIRYQYVQPVVRYVK